MNAPITVSVIGSCRVFKSIRMQKKRGAVEVDHTDAEWYTHSTADALQKIDVVRNIRIPPAHIMPFISNEPKDLRPEKHRPDFYSKTDVFVIELASVKRFVHEGWVLQQWCHKRAAAGEMGPEAAATAAAAEFSIMSESEIAAEMAALCEVLKKPILFVNHVCIVKDSGRGFPEREKLRSVIAEFCASDPRAMAFDPTPIVNAYGVGAAMIDSGHYQPVFEENVLGGRLVEATRDLMARSLAREAAILGRTQ